MHNFSHQKLIQAIAKLDDVPEDSHAFSKWIEAGVHLAFLRQNALDEELVVLASGECSFIHSVAVRNDRLLPVDQDDLMGWSFGPSSSNASYVTEGGRDDVWVERGLSGTDTKTLEGAVQLVFGRTFEGWTGSGRSYYDVQQEYAHLSGIHWRPEKRAYCRFNEDGDLEPEVSVSTREDGGSNVAVVSFRWEPLEEYLVASNSSLVRMFDFTLVRPSMFSGWSDEPPRKYYDSDQLFYRRKVMPAHASYTRGVQIIRPRRMAKSVFISMKNSWANQNARRYVEFIAYDWRNNRIAETSTDPSATTNYFDAKSNSLPFELSPAFFRPEVMLKYKADKDKYTIGDRDVSCRATWRLGGIDVNEAGQVHAYLCDLRHLPFQEQLYWRSFNEPPKASISNRALNNDFKGEWITSMEPLQKVRSVLRRWHDFKVAWWTLRDDKLFDRVHTPLSESRDEWAEAFLDLAKLVVEGFETKPLRARLDAAQVPYQTEERTITLLERLLNKGDTSGEAQKLVGLRSVQNLRSKAKSHASGSEAEKLAQDVLMEHETFGNHFNHVCTQVATELEAIERLIS